MTNKIFIIDLDDTMSDLLEYWTMIYNFMYNDNKNPKDIKGWDIHKYLNKCTEKELFEILETPNMFRNIMHKKGAKKAIDFLRKNGNIVKCATASTHKDIVEDKKYWLKTYMDIDSADCYFQKDKSNIIGDVMIDDYIGNLVTFNGIRILFDSPHNQHITSEDGFDYRMKSWDDFKDIYDNISIRI